MIWLGLAWLGLFWLGLARLGLACSGLAWLGLVFGFCFGASLLWSMAPYVHFSLAPSAPNLACIGSWLGLAWLGLAWAKKTRRLRRHMFNFFSAAPSAPNLACLGLAWAKQSQPLRRHMFNFFLWRLRRQTWLGLAVDLT